MITEVKAMVTAQVIAMVTEVIAKVSEAWYYTAPP